MGLQVLIGCEESGAIRSRARAIGADAWSCDLAPDRKGDCHHLQMDVFQAIDLLSPARGWDIIILHPPCTALASSGNAHYAEGKPGYGARKSSALWTYELWELARKHARIGAALENPVGVLPKLIGPATQYVQPWQFGHGEKKATGFWLDRLPALVPTNIVDGREDRIASMPDRANRQRDRSETFAGIADAIVEQWIRPHMKG
jgi:hypothetical protein